MAGLASGSKVRSLAAAATVQTQDTIIMAIINRKLTIQRIAKFWYIKAAGNTLFVFLFFQFYFHFLHNPRVAVTVMPLTALDQRIPYLDGLLFSYFSLWFYTSLPPALMQGYKRWLYYGFAIAAMCAIGLTIFYLYPTAVPDEYRYAVGKLYILSDIDKPGNAFPSLHVAAAVFTACWNARILSELSAVGLLKSVNAVWAVLIIISTLATRQHVLLDVIAGLVLGLLFAALSLKLDSKWFKNYRT